MIGQPRPTEAQSASYLEQYQKFVKLNSEVETGPDVVDKIFPLLGGIKNVHFSDKGLTLINLEKLLDHIARVKPEFYDGADSTYVDKGLLAELSRFVQPLPKTKYPVFPSFFALLKTKGDNATIAEQQARYAEAIGSRAIHKLRSFAEADQGIVYDDSAYTITASLIGGNLNLYAHHLVQPSAPGDSVTYRMTRIDSFLLGHSLSSFRRGVTALQNSREWARNKREEFIAAAIARGQNRAMTPVPNSPPPSSPAPELPAPERCILS